MYEAPKNSFEKANKSIDTVRSAIRDHTYTDYAFDENRRYDRLTLDQLQANNTVAESVAEKIGWPVASEDTVPEGTSPPYEYANADEFEYEIFEGGKFDRETETFESSQKNLNNLISILESEPVDLDEVGTIVPSQSDSIFGSMPALLRANSVAPDLMLGLRDSLNQAGPNKRSFLHNNPEVLAGMYMAYRIMGRLYSSSDPARHAAILRQDADIEPRYNTHAGIVG